MTIIALGILWVLGSYWVYMTAPDDAPVPRWMYGAGWPVVAGVVGVLHLMGQVAVERDGE